MFLFSLFIRYLSGTPTNPALVGQSTNGDQVTALQISNDWQYFYAGSYLTSSSGFLYQFSRTFGGTLGPLGLTPYITLSDGALSLAIDPSGTVLYLLGTLYLRSFYIASTGILSAAYSYQVATQLQNPLVSGKLTMSFETSQRNIYICNASGNVLTLATVDGSPQVSTVQFATSNSNMCSALAISPTGDYVYVGTNSTPGTVKTFARVIPCQTGQYKNNTKCQNCPRNTFAAAGSTSSSCSPCLVNFFKPDPSRMLNNSDFEWDTSVGLGALSFVTPSGWTSAGTVAVVGSLNTFFGGIFAQSGSRFAALEFAGSYIQQIVYPINSTTYHLTFYAANRANSPGGAAPLAVCTFAILLSI